MSTLPLAAAPLAAAPLVAPAVGSAALAWTAAALMTAGPWLAGVAAARGLRRLLPRHAWLRRLLLLALGAAGAAAAAALVVAEPRLNPYDAPWCAACWVLGLLASGWPRLARPWSARGLAVALLTGGLALAAAELVVRTLPPSGPPVPPPAELHLALPIHTADRRCADLFALTGGHPTRVPRAPGDARPRVVHVGDSMVEGAGVAIEDAFVALLDRDDRRHAHVALASASTGPDFYRAALTLHAPALAPERAVVYLLTGNDVSDLDLPWPCCDDGPLLDDRAALRCPIPRWRDTPRVRLDRGPAPFPLRVAGHSLRLARELVAGFEQLRLRLQGRYPEWLVGEEGYRLDCDDPDAPEGYTGGVVPQGACRFGGYGGRRWARLAQVLAAMADTARADGYALSVVMLPWRAGLTAPDPRATAAWRVHARAVKVATDLGLDVHDAWPDLEAAVRARGDAALFVDDVRDDPHLDEAGHRWLADWVAAHVLAADPPAAPPAGVSAPPGSR